MIPQHIADTPTVTLYYSYHFANGRTEECTYSMPLTDAFSRFISGHNHTLTFTLKPHRIVFEAGATDWEKEV